MLDLGGFNLSAGNLYFGDSATLLRTGGGTLSVSSTVYQYSGSFALAPGDAVGTLYSRAIP